MKTSAKFSENSKFRLFFAENAKILRLLAITSGVLLGLILLYFSIQTITQKIIQENSEREIHSLSKKRNKLDKEILQAEQVIVKQKELINSHRSIQSDLANQAKEKRLAFIKQYGCDKFQSFCDHELNKVVEIPEKIKFRTNSNGDAKTFPPVSGDLVSFVNYYGLNPQDFIDAGNQYNIIPEMIACIARADSDMGKALKSKNNIGNVGNNDRGDTVDYNTMRDGIFAIAKVLNNKYLGDYQTLDQLSRGGGNRDGPVYATSPENWHNNTSNCMHFLRGELV